MNGYSIAKNYRNVRIFWFNGTTKGLIGTTTVTPRKGLDREGRYGAIREEMQRAGLKAPAFKPTRVGAKAAGNLLDGRIHEEMPGEVSCG